MVFINILYLINYAGSAGTEKYTKLLIGEYTKRKNKCYLAYNIKGKLYDDMKAKRIPCFHIKMKNPFDILAGIKLAVYCKKHSIDVIHAQYPRENMIALWSKLFNPGVKVVFTNHLTNEVPFLWRKIIFPLTARFNHKIICVCNEGRKIYLNCNIPASKLEVVLNGIEMPQKNDIAGIRRQYGISSDTFLIVSVARFSPEKGLDFLIDSIKQVNHMSDKKIKLLIVGTGELYEKIEKKIADEHLTELVILTGFRNDVDKILRECNLFINSASCNEACSFAMLEALSNGLPIVATDVGGNSDIVNKKTDCGVLVEYDHIMEMALAINNIVVDSALYSRYCANALKAAREIFSLNIMYDKTFEIYK